MNNTKPFTINRTKRLLLSIATTAAIALSVVSVPAEAGKSPPSIIAAPVSNSWSLPFADAQFATVDLFGNMIAVANVGANVTVGKYDGSGALMANWAFADSNFIVTVATDLTGNVVVASRGTVTSTTSTGLPVFSYTPELPVLAMAVDPSGNVVIAAGDWYTDLVIEKLSATGVHSFTKTFSSTGGIEDFKLATDSAGNIIVAAAYQDGAMNLGGASLTTPGMDSLIVAKLSSTGSHVFSKIFNSTTDTNGSSAGIYEVQLAVRANNEIVVTGTIDGAGKFAIGSKNITLPQTRMETMFVSKFSATGNTAFAKSVNIDGVHVQAVAIDNASNIVVTGEDREGNFLGVPGGIYMAKYAGGNGNLMSSDLVSTGWTNTIAVNPLTNDIVMSGGEDSGTNFVMQLLN